MPWVPIMAALLGAIAAGLFRVLETRAERKRRRGSILKALASEVSTICQMIEAEGYREGLAELVAASQRDDWDGTTYKSDIRSNHFTVFEALASDLGELDGEHAREIVKFYSWCKYALDGLRPDSLVHQSNDKDLKQESIIGLAALVEAILDLGAKIEHFAAIEHEPLNLIGAPKAA